ncbi:uncharacterized protein VTP21DRAFT_10935 [Calcarisporiella thermophila]|uniref:uncharacterized protein n=1 Tax=Calcarisporiella thermophila TaxID=911321 RepID=UPI00374359CA
MTADIVTPGQRVGLSNEFVPGPGTYERQGIVHASIVGVKKLSTNEAGKKVVSVVREKEQSAIPDVGSIITGKVIRINPRFATVAIMVVGSSACREDFQGVIRVQDVRATEKDKVKIYDSFRPGDIVRAEVISLGDARSYYLSTARNELGVIFAKSVADAIMIPISWQEMQCPKTKAIEYRKCAKPF